MILCIDTAINNCGIGLCWEGQMIDTNDSQSAMRASEVLHTMISDMIAKNAISLTDLSAIAINGGPGSYTGLRIAAAAAKGFCYSLDVPLIHINGLELMTTGIINRGNQKGFDYYIPMIDARRDEVFTSVFNQDMETVKEAGAMILDGNSFSDYSNSKCLFFGNGAAKAENILDISGHNKFTDFANTTEDFKELVWKKWIDKNFEDIVNYSPGYLKKFYFIAKIAKK